MKRSSISLAAALSFVVCAAVQVSAQTDQSKKSSDAKTPSAASDPHDLSGVWSQEHPRNLPVVERFWNYTYSKEEPSMTEWGLSQYKMAKSSFGQHTYPLAETTDPLYHGCTPPGLPRIYLHPFPMQIVQMPGEMLILFEYDSMRHQIFTDGRPHNEALGPQWMGDAIGHWEGDTFVVDSNNFSDKTWLDRMGHPHSDQLNVVERFRRVDRDHLTDDITMEDPKGYAKPWVAHLDFVLRPTWTLGEQFCEDEHSFEDFDKSGSAPAK